MKLLGGKHLSLVLVVTLLLCHGVFGGLHMLCHLPVCAPHQEHAAGHQAAAGGLGDAHEHPAGHQTSTEYFAVVAGLLGLLAGLLCKVMWLRMRLGLRRAYTFLRVPAAFRPPRAPTSRVLQVFRL